MVFEVYYWIAGNKYQEDIQADSRYQAMALIRSKYPSAINISCHMTYVKQA